MARSESHQSLHGLSGGPQHSEAVARKSVGRRRGAKAKALAASVSGEGLRHVVQQDGRADSRCLAAECLPTSPSERRCVLFGPKWLPFLDTYRTLCLAPEPDFERMLTEIRHSAATA